MYFRVNPRLTTDIVILDLRNRRERNLHDLTVRNLDLDAGSREGLSRLHAANRTTHPPAVRCNDLYVVFAVKRLQRCECFGYFHGDVLPEISV